MRIIVCYMAQVKQATGVAAEAVELERPCPLPDLLALLADRHGAALRKLLFAADGSLQPGLLVFVGEEQADPDDTRLLGEDEVVTILSPMAGG